MCTSLAMNENRFYFGRNMDLDTTFGEEVVITPRRYPFAFRKEKTCNLHFAMIGMAVVLDSYPLYADAVNEKGLCMAGLNFPDNAVYSESEAENLHNISPFELIPWVLSFCATVDQAKELLKKTHLLAIPFRADIPLTPLHWHIADKESSIVLEVTKDGMAIYDNPVGVLTNNPPFPFHMQNLCHYMNLTNEMRKLSFWDGLQLKPFGMGLGSFGLPGDYSSASRFVKTVFLRSHSMCDVGNHEELAQVFHILSAVAPSKGSVLTEKGTVHYTTYSALMDAEQGIYYYKTYQNSQITAVDMYSENLDSSDLLVFPLVRDAKIQWKNKL